jgi:hypothetical protein
LWLGFLHLEEVTASDLLGKALNGSSGLPLGLADILLDL